MSISYGENAALTCPSCGQNFESEVWMLVDAEERPDLAHALREGTLNLVTCPHCAYHGPAAAPLLFHDPAQRRIYFAAPPGTEEHEWREQAQSLLYVLLNSLPEEARRPYLGDVQVEQEIEGVRRAVLRRQGVRQRARGSGPVADLDPTPPAHGVEHHVVEAAPPDAAPPETPPIFAAIQALLTANSVEEFATIVDEHPALLGDAADEALVQLAEVAFDQGEREVAAALREARVTLAELRAGRGPLAASGGTEAASGPQMAAADTRAPADRGPQLSDAAYQAFLRASSADELIEAVRDHPVLLEAWADADLAARAETALDEGNERMARAVEERREILAEMRAELIGQAPLAQAVQALMRASGEDELAQVLDEYPILLTDTAQDALFNLAGSARAQGDHQLAEHAIECRAMLRQVREGLEEG